MEIQRIMTLKPVLAACCMACLAFTALSPARAENAVQSAPNREPVQTVNGRNDPSLDVAAVQKAVDQGGTVFLKGRFDFGAKGNVTIKKDVKIIGQSDGHGHPKTLVEGGEATFNTERPETLTRPGPNVTISSIHFDGASWMPIRLPYLNGATITSNKITNVHPLPHAVKTWKPYSMQAGVFFGTFMTRTLDRQEPYIENAVTGVIDVIGNEFDLTVAKPTETMGQAIFALRTTGIIANFERNTIRNASRNAFEILDNFRGANGQGRILIQDNIAETPTEGVPYPTPATPNGIACGYFLDAKSAVDPARTIPHLILHNHIRTKGVKSVGIFVLMDGASVRHNEISINGTDSFAVVITGSHNDVGDNRIEGSGVAGFSVGPFPPMTGSSNTIENNTFEHLKVAEADVRFRKGASNNVVRGSAGTVSDLGVGNQPGELQPAIQGQ